MATKEELSERLARVETRIERCQEDISRLEANIDSLKREVRDYVDSRGKELFQLCLQEQNDRTTEVRKSNRALSLSRWQVIIAVIGILLLIVAIILQALDVI